MLSSRQENTKGRHVEGDEDAGDELWWKYIKSAARMPKKDVVTSIIETAVSFEIAIV